MKLLNNVTDLINDKLRLLCGSLSYDARIVITVVMILFFSVTSIYIFIRSIYNIGKHEGERLQIEHIKTLNLNNHKTESDNISIFKLYEYGRE